MYSEHLLNSPPTITTTIHNNSPDKMRTPKQTNPYLKHTRQQHTRSKPQSDSSINTNVEKLLKRDVHSTPSSRSSLSSMASSSTASSQSASQYEPSTIGHVDIPCTPTLRTRSRTFYYPYSYDSEDTHSSQYSFHTPVFNMLVTSSSSNSTVSIPPLNIRQTPTDTISPLSYPEVQPLQPYDHEQVPSSDDNSESGDNPHKVNA